MSKLSQRLKSLFEGGGSGERPTIYWNSVDVLDGDEYDRTMVLQQRIIPNNGRSIMYRGKQHRLVPLSDIQMEGKVCEDD